MENLFEAIAKTGTENAKVEYLNLPKYVKTRLNKVLKEEPIEVQNIYAQSQTKQYRDEMEPIIRGLLKKYDFNLKFGEIVRHVEQQELTE